MGIYFDQNNKMVFDCRDGIKVINSNCDPTGISITVVYGQLYNWYAITGTSSNSIANTDWHVPTASEYLTLSNFVLNGDSDRTEAHKRFKVSGTTYWDTDEGTNTVGFNAKGNGIREYTGVFTYLKDSSYSHSNDVYIFNGQYGLYITDPAANLAFFFAIAGLTVDQEKSRGMAIRLQKDSTTLTSGQTGTYIGNDNKIYPTIAIGNPAKEWLAVNLCETKYRDGTTIPEVTGTTAWSSLTTGAWCSYNNNPNNSYIYEDNPFDSHLKACWTFEEGSGTFYDQTTNNNDLTSINGVTYQQSGKLGSYSARFTESTAYAEGGDGLELTILSISAWIKITGTTANYRGIYAKDNNTIGHALYVDESGHPGWGMYTPGFSNDVSTTTVNDGNWHHILATISGGTSSTVTNIYVDNGTPKYIYVSSGLTNPTANYRVGGWSSLSTYGIRGYVDSVMVWDKILSASERNYIYNSGTGRDCSTD